MSEHWIGSRTVVTDLGRGSQGCELEAWEAVSSLGQLLELNALVECEAVNTGRHRDVIDDALDGGLTRHTLAEVHDLGMTLD